jgi:hypothetical protein
MYSVARGALVAARTEDGSYEEEESAEVEAEAAEAEAGDD